MERRWDVSFTLVLKDTELSGLDDNQVENDLVQRLMFLTDSLKEHFKKGSRILTKTGFKKDSPGFYDVVATIENESVCFRKTK